MPGSLFGWGGIGNSENQEQTTNIDQSQSFSLADQSEGAKIGSTLLLAGSEGSTVNLLDGGAIQALSENTFKLIDSNAKTIQNVADSAQLAVTKSMELADKARQSDTQAVFGTFGKAVPWLAGAAAVAAVALAAYFWRDK